MSSLEFIKSFNFSLIWEEVAISFVLSFGAGLMKFLLPLTQRSLIRSLIIPDNEYLEYFEQYEQYFKLHINPFNVTNQKTKEYLETSSSSYLRT